MRILRLDGIRAVAIVCVFLHHYGLMPGGWAGVDIFFVLSGFLITGILRRERAETHYWRRFYTKRATRILPPVLLVIGLYCLRDRPPVASALAYTFFLANFSVGTRFAIPPLNALWSLAVEEHFYLFFPSAVRTLQRRTLMAVLLTVIVLEPLARMLATGHVHEVASIYLWTPFRLDGLAMGALLALYAEDQAAVVWLTRWSGSLAIAGVVAFTGLSVFLSDRFTRDANSAVYHLFGYSLIAAISTLAVAYVLWHPQAPLSRFLGTRPMVFLGSISYGFYLYHLQVRDTMTRYIPLTYRQAAPLGFLGSVLVSWLSFRYFETPFLRWGHRMAAKLQTRKLPDSQPLTLSRQ